MTWLIAGFFNRFTTPMTEFIVQISVPDRNSS